MGLKIYQMHFLEWCTMEMFLQHSMSIYHSVLCATVFGSKKTIQIFSSSVSLSPIKIIFWEQLSFNPNFGNFQYPARAM